MFYSGFRVKRNLEITSNFEKYTGSSCRGQLVVVLSNYYFLEMNLAVFLFACSLSKVKLFVKIVLVDVGEQGMVNYDILILDW